MLPDGLDKLDAWSDKAEVIQGQRYTLTAVLSSGSIVLVPLLGIYNPLAKAGFDGAGVPQVQCYVL